MYKPEVAFYLGEQKQQGFSGIVQKDNLFFILEVGTGMSEDQGHKTLDFVKEKIKKINNFDDFIASIITENNLPSDFSIASGFIKDNILYLKTVGTGKVFIRRKNKLGLLIEGNTTASGPVENNDFFIFTTDNFFEIVGGRQGLENTFDHRSPTEIIDEITPSLKAKNDQGAVALFVNLHQIVEDDQVSFRPSPDEIGMTKGRIKSIWFSMKSSKKTLTFITVFI